MNRDAQPSGAPLHQHRSAAESFGTDAERYERTRPPYPKALIDRIAAISPVPTVLDVGTGTGIAARQLQAAGCTVLAVEPDPRMADYARRHGTEVEVSTFEDWDPAGRTFDAVVAGSAWHWVNPTTGATKAAQVLRPGGRLVPFWHIFQLPLEIVDAFATAYQRVAPDNPFHVERLRHALDGLEALIAPAADAIRSTGLFSEPEQWRFDWQHTYTKDEWLDQMPTSGGLTQLPAESLAEVLTAVGTTIDAMGGSFTMAYATIAINAIRFR
ncbi:class I SAM-dependent methyltransferase [Cryptosporangium sp. NPDC048952]|uniref:class I SAM-dependent methyltransferase n=1 Tax=Cryptosporangium sp. NPDC048952 TaxID=3363961 RepID=UPI00371943E8